MQFRAAKSRWMNLCWERYSIPREIWWHILNSSFLTACACVCVVWEWTIHWGTKTNSANCFRENIMEREETIRNSLRPFHCCSFQSILNHFPFSNNPVHSHLSYVASPWKHRVRHPDTLQSGAWREGGWNPSSWESPLSEIEYPIKKTNLKIRQIKSHHTNLIFPYNSYIINLISRCYIVAMYFICHNALTAKS